jgi:hypothetical protein
MSRRHHGRSRHAASRRPRPDATPGDVPAADASRVAPDGPPAAIATARAESPDGPTTESAGSAPANGPVAHGPVDRDHGGHAPDSTNGAQRLNGGGGPGGGGGNGCTAPQLRRFIKSRPYVPMHELRRRFGIDGNDDDVTQVRLDGSAIYVGLPAREGGLLGELLRGGEIGYELSLDPRTPIVVGVYPMRPVPRG